MREPSSLSRITGTVFPVFVALIIPRIICFFRFSFERVKICSERSKSMKRTLKFPAHYVILTSQTDSRFLPFLCVIVTASISVLRFLGEKGVKSMRQKICTWIQRYGTKLCALAMAAAVMASESSRTGWYQPEEPEDLAAFIARNRK